MTNLIKTKKTFTRPLLHSHLKQLINVGGWIDQNQWLNDSKNRKKKFN